MGIQPIDLQTMYSQLSNASKTLTANQQVQLSEAMQQQNNIQKNLEKSKKVQEASNDQSSAGQVNGKGSNSTAYFSKRNKDNEKSDNEESEEKAEKGDLPYLGTLIDITR